MLYLFTEAIYKIARITIGIPPYQLNKTLANKRQILFSIMPKIIDSKPSGPSKVHAKHNDQGLKIVNLHTFLDGGEGYVWTSWQVLNNLGQWVMMGDQIYLKCTQEDDFCTSENPCGKDEGDCDTHDECQVNLFCGSNNCPNYLGFHSEFDCCYAPAVGDEHFCSPTNPCGQHEGDCDSTNECQTNLICDTAHSSPAYLGFMSDVNICVNISEVSRCKYSN